MNEEKEKQEQIPALPPHLVGTPRFTPPSGERLPGLDELRQMSESEINDRWNEVCAALRRL